MPNIKEQSVYQISNAHVKVANQKFTRVKNDYCLNFHSNTQLEPAKDTTDIAKVGFNFKALSYLATATQAP